MTPFWSDDFDMDLLKVYPNAAEALGAMATVPVWTVGGTTFDRLNHPARWNTHGAWLWIEKPNLQRDNRGWFNVSGCVGDSQEVEATWLEFLRDQWAHQFGFIVVGTYSVLHPCEWRVFERLMWHLRGWEKYADIDTYHEKGWNWLTGINQQFRGTMEYLKPGSVPDTDMPAPARERPGWITV